MSRLLAGSSSRLILVGVQTKPAPPVWRYAIGVEHEHRRGGRARGVVRVLVQEPLVDVEVAGPRRRRGGRARDDQRAGDEEGDHRPAGARGEPPETRVASGRGGRPRTTSSIASLGTAGRGRPVGRLTIRGSRAATNGNDGPPGIADRWRVRAPERTVNGAPGSGSRWAAGTMSRAPRRTRGRAAGRRPVVAQEGCVPEAHVVSVSGPRPVGVLGVVDAHDHLFIDSPAMPGQAFTDPERAIEEALDGRETGIGTIVEMTPIGLGRRPGGHARGRRGHRPDRDRRQRLPPRRALPRRALGPRRHGRDARATGS